MIPTPEQITAWLERAVSWSQLSSFAWNKDDWYSKYVLGIEQPLSPELIFGKKFADSCEAGTPLASVTLLSKQEQPLEAVLDGIKLFGYADTIKEETMDETGEFKTGAKPWDQARVDTHGQITMYALMNFLQNKVLPQNAKFWLEWVPTKKVHRDNGDFSGYDYDIEFASDPPTVQHFDTKRTMKDILAFASYIKATRKEMEEFIHSKTV